MLKLYSYYRSSAAFCVRIALEIKGLDWESIPVNLRLGGQKQQRFQQNNPQGLIPFL
jgi:glutathione S-transferase